MFKRFEGWLRTKFRVSIIVEVFNFVFYMKPLVLIAIYPDFKLFTESF